jgi:hypothetical protein
MKLQHIFNVFSRRDKVIDPYVYAIPVTFRNKVIMLCRDIFSNRLSQWNGDDYTSSFWDEVHQALRYRHGKFQLVEDTYPQSRSEDAIRFLLSCKDEEFLDFLEYIFKVKCLFHIHLDENQIVGQLNELFTADGIGYELTDMVKETVTEAASGPPFFGREMNTIKVVSYPTVIRKDNQFAHAGIVQPALQLLAEKKYKMADQEFIEALEDYRKKDYGDCLTKCCSAFESVMKVICHEKGWTYKQTDTANILVSTIISNTGLDSFFDQPLMIIATLRNRLSKSHGAGTHPKSVSQNLAQYALNATASAIILLVNETK